MKTKEQLLSFIKQEYTSGSGVAWNKFALYFEYGELWALTGFMSKQYNVTPKEVTYENIVKDLEEDTILGLKAAKNRSSITSTIIYESIRIWLWILEDELYDFDKYSPCGLPLYEAVTLKYNF